MIGIHLNSLQNPSVVVKKHFKQPFLYLGSFSLAVLLFGSVDYFGAGKVTCSGTIIDKHYKPEQVRLTKVQELDADGTLKSYFTSKIEPASWEILTQSKSGKSVRLECKRDEYYAMLVGEPIEYVSIQGYLTNWVYRYSGISSGFQETLVSR